MNNFFENVSTYGTQHWAGGFFVIEIPCSWFQFLNIVGDRPAIFLCMSLQGLHTYLEIKS